MGLRDFLLSKNGLARSLQYALHMPRSPRRKEGSHQLIKNRKGVTLESIDWNITDAKQALACAVALENWEGVIKYAHQLQALEEKRFRLISPVPSFCQQVQ